MQVAGSSPAVGAGININMRCIEILYPNNQKLTSTRLTLT